jgi:hypothetical protein
MARSAQSIRGRGLVRRRTATSCRSTRSSTSLVVDVRPVNRTSPSTCRKIKYSNRSGTLRSCPTPDHRWSATLPRVLEPHRPTVFEFLSAEDGPARAFSADALARLQATTNMPDPAASS